MVLEGVKQDDEFKCWISVSKKTDIAEECLRIELNSQSLRVVRTFSYLGDIIEHIVARIKNGVSLGFFTFLNNWGLTLRAKGTLHSTCVPEALCYMGEDLPIKEDHAIRLERNDERMVI